MMPAHWPWPQRQAVDAVCRCPASAPQFRRARTASLPTLPLSTHAKRLISLRRSAALLDEPAGAACGNRFWNVIATRALVKNENGALRREPGREAIRQVGVNEIRGRGPCAGSDSRQPVAGRLCGTDGCRAATTGERCTRAKHSPGRSRRQRRRGGSGESRAGNDVATYGARQHADRRPDLVQACLASTTTCARGGLSLLSLGCARRNGWKLRDLSWLTTLGPGANENRKWHERPSYSPRALAISFHTAS